MKILGIEGMTLNDVNAEVQRGGKFVIFYYCVSVIILTLKRPSSIHFIRAGDNNMGMAVGLTLVSLVFGWWGIPWGPIYTVQSVWINLNGGKDVTAEVLGSIRTQP